MTSVKDLPSCPFCGGSDFLLIPHASPNVREVVQCNGCGCGGPVDAYMRRAVPRVVDLELTAKAGVEMRKAQQVFFDAEDRNNRRHLLNRSKEKEREFDRLAAKALSPQGGLNL